MAGNQERPAFLRDCFRSRLRAAESKEQVTMKRLRVATLPALLVCLCANAPAPAADIRASGDAQWIEDAGGTVIRDAGGRITGVDLHASWVTDTDLRKLLQLPSLSYLDLSLTRI